jgi:hypothetical protein
VVHLNYYKFITEEEVGWTKSYVYFVSKRVFET